jgi:hypothetical protein
MFGDSVAIGIRVLVQIAVVGFEDEHHSVLQRQRDARHHQAIGKHCVPVVGAVAV